MTVRFNLQGQEFEWDEAKARLNFEKHGVTFLDAARAYLDPLAVHGDASPSDEDRGWVIGFAGPSRVLYVVHTERAVATRIISARPATAAERRLYERDRS
jgi:uncharacterized DUF497 family protein